MLVGCHEFETLEHLGGLGVTKMWPVFHEWLLHRTSPFFQIWKKQYRRGQRAIQKTLGDPQPPLSKHAELGLRPWYPHLILKFQYLGNDPVKEESGQALLFFGHCDAWHRMHRQHPTGPWGTLGSVGLPCWVCGLALSPVTGWEVVL